MQNFTIDVATSTERIANAAFSVLETVGIKAVQVAEYGVKGQFVEGCAKVGFSLAILCGLAFAWVKVNSMMGEWGDDVGVESTAAMVKTGMFFAYLIIIPTLIIVLYGGIIHIFAPEWSLIQDLMPR